MKREELIEKAKEYESNNDWQPAFDIYEDLSRQYSDDMTFIERMAWCASRLSKYDVAIKAYTLLTERQPESAKWCYCVGYQYYMQKIWATANKWFEKALILYPDYLVVKYRYAYSLRQICGSVMALKKDEYWKALKQLSECDQIWNCYTPELQKKNKDIYASICFQYAKLLIERNHLEEAIRYLEKSLTIKPNNEEYQYQLSKSYLSLGEVEKAKVTFPHNSQKYYVKELEINILIADGRRNEAIDKCSALLKYRKKDYLYRDLGMLYYEIGNMKDAILNVLQAERINSKNHLTQFAKGKILYKAGFLIAAKNAIELAASLKKTNYSSDYIEAIEFSKMIQQQIADESYSSDDENALSSFIHQQSAELLNKRLYGRILHYNFEKGFGFIECNNTQYFFHISNVPKQLQNRIVEGLMLSFLPIKTEKGLSAINIIIEN